MDDFWGERLLEELSLLDSRCFPEFGLDVELDVFALEVDVVWGGLLVFP